MTWFGLNFPYRNIVELDSHIRFLLLESKFDVCHFFWKNLHSIFGYKMTNKFHQTPTPLRPLVIFNVGDMDGVSRLRDMKFN